MVFYNESGKWKAVVTEIKRMNKAGRPVLVGTTSVERSELLAQRLDQADIKYQVRLQLASTASHAACPNTGAADLVAGFCVMDHAGGERMQSAPTRVPLSYDPASETCCARSAAAERQAGERGEGGGDGGAERAAGRVTIATNMAGRGTDILLGGNAEYMARLKLRELLMPPSSARSTTTIPRWPGPAGARCAPNCATVPSSLRHLCSCCRLHFIPSRLFALETAAGGCLLCMHC